MRRIGVIGLGGMGQALTKCLLAKGYQVTCYDRRDEAVASMSVRGASPAMSARRVAENSDVVFTSLPGPAQVLDVALDPELGVLVGLAPGAALFDMSTCSPEVAEELEPAFTRAGRVFVDCPVSGKAPSMVVLVGGEDGVFGQNEQVLQEVSSKLIYCGRPGAGYATKLLNQHVKYSWYIASAEALLVAKKMGLDVAGVATAIQESSGGRSGFTHAAEYYRKDTQAMQRRAPASTIEKDMLLAEAMAFRAGVDCPSLTVVADFFREVSSTPFRQKPYPESNELLEIIRTSHAKTDV